MSIFDFFLKRPKNKLNPTSHADWSLQIQNDNSLSTRVAIQTEEEEDETEDYAFESEYVELSTSGDESVCPMCAQFEGKIFPKMDAPKLPLCPSCACAYLYYGKKDLPPGSVISNKADFVLPAKCTSLFYKHQKDFFKENDINKKIRLCESDLKKLPEFMAPYISAGFAAPDELICRDFLPDLYISIGELRKAENTIKKCIASNAYFPDDGSEILANFESYKKIATETLDYILQNPGCLQRNIYKSMGYEGEQKEMLKKFLRQSRQIEKVKCNNTNQLYYKKDPGSKE